MWKEIDGVDISLILENLDKTGFNFENKKDLTLRNLSLYVYRTNSQQLTNDSVQPPDFLFFELNMCFSGHHLIFVNTVRHKKKQIINIYLV